MSSNESHEQPFDSFHGAGFSLSLAMRGCRDGCPPCGPDILDNDSHGMSHPKLCSWEIEEEVSMPMSASGRAGRMVVSRAALQRRSVPSSSSSPRARQSLFPPGGLAPIRVVGHERLEHGSTANRSASSDAKQLLADTYALDEQSLGRGSYGEVFGATHLNTGARRAVKSVGKAGLRRYVKDVSAFVRREVDILRKLDHPNVVRLFEAFEDDQYVHLVLELCEGGDLLERVAAAKERLPERDAAMLTSQILAAIQHMHRRGVVHRDIKPENFLFSRREPQREPRPPQLAPLKLIDFGLSRRLGIETGQRVTPKIGTTEYMAPEALAGNVNAQQASLSDLWSVGVVLHVIFSGHFPSPKLKDISTEEYMAAPCWSRISASGRDMLAQLLRQDPRDRPSATIALQHPWLMSTAFGSSSEPVYGLPAAIRTFCAAPLLRRLALLAIAREADDLDVCSLRKEFLLLEVACKGALTRQSIEAAARSLKGTAAVVAGELSRLFDSIDIDVSGAVDWTEMLASALSTAECISPAYRENSRSSPEPMSARSASPWSPRTGHGTSSPRPNAQNAGNVRGAGMPELRVDACWRAFDLLSQGSGSISSEALVRLFTPSETSSNGGMPKRAAPAGPSRDSCALEFNRIICEIEPSGKVSYGGFMRLVEGKPGEKTEVYAGSMDLPQDAQGQNRLHGSNASHDGYIANPRS